MNYLILIRHGQSTWNLENRFTGWVDVDLTDKGKTEAKNAGNLIKKENIEINYFYSSFQSRANNTLKLIQEVLGNNKNFTRAWQLNERHYGALTGLNKTEMSEKLGEEHVYKFRRSWDLRPSPLNKNLSFDKALNGDFNLENDLINDQINKKYIYTGCQIINRNLFKGEIQNIFSIYKIWKNLIQSNKLYGFESKLDFYHLTDLEIFKKLKDF